jgi:hypothetical protein
MSNPLESVSTRRQLRAIDPVPPTIQTSADEIAALREELRQLRFTADVLGQAVAFFAGAAPQPPRLMAFLQLQVRDGRDLEAVCDVLRSSNVAADPAAFRSWTEFSQARAILEHPSPAPLTRRSRRFHR